MRFYDPRAEALWLDQINTRARSERQFLAHVEKWANAMERALFVPNRMPGTLRDPAPSDPAVCIATNAAVEAGLLAEDIENAAAILKDTWIFGGRLLSEMYTEKHGWTTIAGIVVKELLLPKEEAEDTPEISYGQRLRDSGWRIKPGWVKELSSNPSSNIAYFHSLQIYHPQVMRRTDPTKVRYLTIASTIEKKSGKTYARVDMLKNPELWHNPAVFTWDHAFYKNQWRCVFLDKACSSEEEAMTLLEEHLESIDALPTLANTTFKDSHGNDIGQRMQPNKKGTRKKFYVYERGWVPGGSTGGVVYDLKGNETGFQIEDLK